MNQKKRYYAVGLAILVFQVGLVVAVRLSRGTPPALSVEPYKTTGPIDAPVQIANFSDLGCGYCRRLKPVLEELQKTFPSDLRIAFKHYPVVTDRSPKAAEASECAADQGKFWEYVHLVMDDTYPWVRGEDPAKHFNKLAADLGLDAAQFGECLESGKKRPVVERNKKEGKSYFVQGTPTLILNGRRVLLSEKFDYLKKAVEEELRAGRRG